MPRRGQAERPRRPRMAHQSRALIALLLTIGLVVLLLPSVALAGPPKPPAGSCIGTDACAGNTGGLGTNACVGIHACFTNAGSIAKDACHESGACELNTGAVGVGACQGIFACLNNSGSVAREACIGTGACEGN